LPFYTPNVALVYIVCVVNRIDKTINVDGELLAETKSTSIHVIANHKFYSRSAEQCYTHQSSHTQTPLPSSSKALYQLVPGRLQGLRESLF